MSEPRCYTVPELLAKLKLSKRTFERYQHRLDFLEELQPRIGHIRRYRADPVDRYLAGTWVAIPHLVVRRRR